MVAQQQRLNALSFNEAELQTLFDSASLNYKISRAVLTDRERLVARIKETVKRVDGILKIRRELIAHVQKAEQDLRKILKSFDDEMAWEEAMLEIGRRETVLQDVLGQIQTLKKDIDFSPADNLPDIQSRLRNFWEAVHRARATWKRIEEKDTIEKGLAKTIKEAEARLEQSRPKLDRGKAAVQALDKLISKKSKESELKASVSDQMDRLSAIFSRIHAPNEFSDVLLNGEIRLKRRESGSVARVSEISTGQRAALAVSIFLSLNSGVSRKAPWMLFDDPVAHVDDLNTLSFLDTLRDLVLLGGRQVFFATANSRIADLFTKKFSFLAGEFREFRMSP